MAVVGSAKIAIMNKLDQLASVRYSTDIAYQKAASVGCGSFVTTSTKQKNRLTYYRLKPAFLDLDHFYLCENRINWLQD